MGVIVVGVDSDSGVRGVVQKVARSIPTQSVLENDTEPPTSPDVQVGTLDSSLRQHCVNG